MTAALLRNELFHHLLASNPEKTSRDNVRAGVVALAFHVGLLLLLLQRPTAQRAASEPVVSTPILLESFADPGYVERGPTGGGNPGIIGGPPVLTLPEPTDGLLPPAPTNVGINDGLRPINLDPPARAGGAGGGQQGVQRTDNFTVVQSAPRMLNPEEVSALLRREYPQMLMQAGIGGTVVMHVLIDPAGHVMDARIAQSSGVRGLDEAALRVSRHMQFAPAQNRNEAVRVWAEIPVVFSARD